MFWNTVFLVRLRFRKMTPYYLFHRITMEICSSSLEFIYLSNLTLIYLAIWFLSFQKQPLEVFCKKQVFLKIGVLKIARWKMYSKSLKKTYEEVHFSKVAGYLSVTLLKMKFFIGIFQGFWQQTSEHFFYKRTIFDWLLLSFPVSSLLRVFLNWLLVFLFFHLYFVRIASGCVLISL